MSDETKNENAVLSFFNLSDEYERKARFLPAVLSILVLLPVGMAFGVPVMEFVRALLAGVGATAVLAVGLSHAASAMGNRLQRKLWPDWPFDAPTNQWLLPGDPSRSIQQKEQWYAAIQRLTGLDIPEAAATEDERELTRVINDAVTALRSRLCKAPGADLLRLRNVEFGYARNLTGLRPLWVLGSILSCAGCWIAATWFGGSVLWALVASVLVLVLPVLGFTVLPGYVRQKAGFYAEAFFAAMMQLDDPESRNRDAASLGGANGRYGG
ncbi:MAG: hypothetical protein RBS80_29475 [Thermoguttaceae bacterium]|jgi:hypothetical protein|nr:hypothetical protein [Thermoguttaceae bacterium]